MNSRWDSFPRFYSPSKSHRACCEECGTYPCECETIARPAPSAKKPGADGKEATK